MVDAEPNSDGYEVEVEALREEVRLLNLALVLVAVGSSEDTIGDVRRELDEVDEILRGLQELTTD